jgi:undecaprenyl-diphosphatase
MLESLLSFDHSLFYTLNGQNAPWLDPLMFWASKSIVWLPLFAFLFYLCLKTFGWKTITVLAALALTLTFSDQLSNLVKNDVKRLRPSNQPGMSEAVHIVNGYRGGEFGFYSAHATNTFAVAVFLLVLFQGRYRFLYVVLPGWAFLMTYTRLYLGVHYPLDLISGGVAGVLIGWFAGRVTLYFLSLQGYGTRAH